MKTTKQRMELESGDQVTLAMPNGQEIQIGFGGNGQVPQNRPYIFIGSSENGGANSEGERAFEVLPDKSVKEYSLS